jgi:hypothetical protein
MPPEEIAALRPWLGRVRWSANTLARFVTPLREAARTSGRPLAETVRQVLSGLDLGPDLSPNDRIARLAQAARTVRYPVLTDLEERFAALSRGMARGTAFTLHPSRGFESDAVTLTAQVTDAASLDRAAADLAALAGHPDWRALWSVARGQEAGPASPDGGGDHDA